MIRFIPALALVGLLALVTSTTSAAINDATETLSNGFPENGANLSLGANNFTGAPRAFTVRLRPLGNSGNIQIRWTDGDLVNQEVSLNNVAYFIAGDTYELDITYSTDANASTGLGYFAEVSVNVTNTLTNDEFNGGASFDSTFLLTQANLATKVSLGDPTPANFSTTGMTLDSFGITDQSNNGGGGNDRFDLAVITPTDPLTGLTTGFSLTGEFTFDPGDVTGDEGLVLEFVVGGDRVELIPEPASAALLGLAGLALLRRRRQTA